MQIQPQAHNFIGFMKAGFHDTAMFIRPHFGPPVSLK
jgi:hypothetical protein